MAGAAAVAGATEDLLQAQQHGAVRIVVEEGDVVAAGRPVGWAVRELRRALVEKSQTCEVVSSADQAKGSNLIVVVSGKGTGGAQTSAAQVPESLRIEPSRIGGTPALTVSGGDTRGLVYGLLELADRVQNSTDSSLGLRLSGAIAEAPASRVRCVARAFCSDIEDKSWYYDKDFWRGYLDMLAMSRFNRFAFAFGFGYDFPTGVTGDYFHFPYPYLVEVPGYDVRVVPLPEGERARNLEMLQFIAAETAARGLQFQLGIWTHAYEWTKSPKADHHITGLNAENHAAYCRDALAMILKACPEISGLTMRVHGESGIPEGSYGFWETLFEAITKCGRKVEIDMHAKGINQIMIDMAAKTGMPVKVSAKSWAEHMGLGYQQADIRELEIPRADRMEQGTFNVSNGARRFTRYGYADLFQEGQKYEVLFRLWPGTQRHLLWGDPETAAGYGRTAHFCDAAGLEICEPLTFKGREGSGLPGGRCAYADAALEPKRGDWRKFEYTYRVWGRLLYNPDADPEVWRRYLRTRFGEGSMGTETALSNASRVLPLVTTAHLPSASNHSFWPEIYDNMPVVLGSEKSPYGDTPDPKCFGTVSPLDPQIFSSITEHIGDLLGDHGSPKYSPIEVAQWLEDFTTASSAGLDSARKRSLKPGSPEFRRMEEDVLIQIGLGRFFAAKLRSGTLYEIFQQTGSAEAGKMAVAKYAEAREAWATMAQRAKTVYRPDISYGSIPMRRGHWADRLPGIDRDLEAMRASLSAAPKHTQEAPAERVSAAIKTASGRPLRSSANCSHTPPESFRPGQPLQISVSPTGGESMSGLELYYRHVNQGERWRSMPMTKSGSGYGATIPGDYTQSSYPLQYYFVLRGKGSATFSPAFNASLSNQPYHAVWRRQA